MANDMNITEEILQDCIQRISLGDSSGFYDFALTLAGHIPERKNWLDVLVVEALLLAATKDGYSEAKDYLETTWPQLKEAFHMRFGPNP